AAQLSILPYNRVVRDLGAKSVAAVLDELAALGSCEAVTVAPETGSGVFGVYLPGQWYRLAIDPETINERDPIKSLDAELLYDRVLAPILAIGDIRTDP